MDATDYLRVKERMCHETACAFCPFSKYSTNEELCCDDVEANRPTKAVDLVEEWGKKHPAKTYLKDFLERFPDAVLDNKGYPCNCVRYLYGNEHAPAGCSTGECSCVDCWGRTIPLSEVCKFYKDGVCIAVKWEKSCKCGGDVNCCERG